MLDLGCRLEQNLRFVPVALGMHSGWVAEPLPEPWVAPPAAPGSGAAACAMTNDRICGNNEAGSETS